MRENRGASYMDSYDKGYEQRKYSGTKKKILTLNLCALCSKWILFIVNMLLLLFGAAVLIIAIYIKDNPNSISDVDINVLSDEIFYLALTIAIALIILALLGCGGAYSHSKCLLIVYIVLLVIILICEIVVVSLAFQKSTIKNYLNDQWDNLSASDKAKIEEKYECCGFESPDDTTDPPCVDYTQGCYDSLRDAIADQTYLIAYIAIGAGLYQIFMLILSLCLCFGSRKKEDVSIV